MWMRAFRPAPSSASSKTRTPSANSNPTAPSRTSASWPRSKRGRVSSPAATSCILRRRRWLLLLVPARICLRTTSTSASSFSWIRTSAFPAAARSTRRTKRINRIGTRLCKSTSTNSPMEPAKPASPTRHATSAPWWATSIAPYSTVAFSCTPRTARTPAANCGCSTKLHPWPSSWSRPAASPPPAARVSPTSSPPTSTSASPASWALPTTSASFLRCTRNRLPMTTSTSPDVTLLLPPGSAHSRTHSFSPSSSSC
mmetsp:Transcript_4955/g.15544  ORF Transcript_4955/g.15544 Transcript_4955/m.15544 type:complete len:256 (+) Transcript_4955:644-1411(+)